MIEFIAGAACGAIATLVYAIWYAATRAPRAQKTLAARRARFESWLAVGEDDDVR